MRMSTGLIVLLLATACISGLPAGAETPPDNDAFASAEDVTVPSLVQGTLAGATIEPGEPSSGCGVPTASVWYRLNVHVPTPVSLSLRDVAGDPPVAAVFIGSGLEDLDPVECSDPGFLNFFASPSETYFIRLAEKPGAQTGGFTLSWGLGLWEQHSGPFFLFAAGAGFNAEADGATAVVAGYVVPVGGSVIVSSYMDEGSEASVCAGIIIVLPPTCVTA